MTLITGWFSYDVASSHLLTQMLPALLFFRMDAARTSAFQATLDLLARETEMDAPGANAAIRSLANILFIQALRARIDASDGQQQRGLLAGLAHARLRHAIERMYNQIDHPGPLRNWPPPLACLARLSRFTSAT
ncbi:hypothetical protein CLG96_16655 [Sphingomonas oleivorans]|uniref:AraC-type transcription regulator ligand-binding domain-containing protein n=1 Tax=Sphingomonas oleivorans TaxID=1735121 RepID=A0A2T5FU35_9SPHN|nr:cupin domain-containing protein [Sphingomonas oleivorans]PTQ07781.1 hypothetical protein CLG96_16655 [Sphingomonas oleivorans]